MRHFLRRAEPRIPVQYVARLHLQMVFVIDRDKGQIVTRQNHLTEILLGVKFDEMGKSRSEFESRDLI